MTFRRDFLDIVRSADPSLPMEARESVFLNTIDRGLTAQHREIALLRREIDSRLSEGADRYAEATDEASQAISNEIAYQAEETRRVALGIAAEINWNIEHARVYLGAQICEVRWAVERNTEVTKDILDSLWKTHWIDSRQFFDEGIRCYESAEREFARERFQKATEACRTNGFAYQYLGFLSVHDDDQAQALRYFELAAKFAPNDHHRAIAHYHLSRAWHASGNENASLDQIRLAVALAPKDLPYRFELVRALVRAGLKQEAVRDLRDLISADLRYWTAVAIDRALDPIRPDVTDLLSRMREEAGGTANRILANFFETLRLAESLPEQLPFVSGYARDWKRSVESLMAKGTIFEQKKVIDTVPQSHREFVRKVIDRYETHLSESRDRVTRLSADKRGEVEGIRSELRALKGQFEEVDTNLASQEAQITTDLKSKGGGYAAALGCSGLLAVLGLLIFGGIFLEFFGIKRSTGLPDTLGKLALFSPLLIIGPLLIAMRSMVFRGKRRQARLIARASKVKIEQKINVVEEAVCKAEAAAMDEVKSLQASFDRLETVCQANLALLRERLAVAESDERISPFRKAEA